MCVAGRAASPGLRRLRCSSGSSSGLHGGEEIAFIEGIRGTELSESEGRALIRDAPGTGVTLEIAPASGGAARTVVIVRVEAKDED